MTKPDWDTYFLAQCFLISMRSIDPSTKHGAVIVDKHNRILSTGYNSPLRGIDETKIPHTRPEKYPFYIHAEENAVLALGENAFLENAKIYVTGRPCHKCMRMILQKGIKTIIHGPQGSKCVDVEDYNASQLMVELSGATVYSYPNCMIDTLKHFVQEYAARIMEIQYK